jgi:hypothetical protein
MIAILIAIAPIFSHPLGPCVSVPAASHFRSLPLHLSVTPGALSRRYGVGGRGAAYIGDTRGFGTLFSTQQ